VSQGKASVIWRKSLVHQKRRALVVVTLQDHEAWLANILTSWQFTA
jgi:hypothetical protein